MNARLPASAFEPERALAEISQTWDREIVPRLQDYIAIPAKSPMFDPQWAQHGHIDTVVRNAAAWVESQKVEGLKLEVIRLEGRTPVLFFELPASRGAGGAERASCAASGSSSRSRAATWAVRPRTSSACCGPRSRGNA